MRGHKKIRHAILAQLKPTRAEQRLVHSISRKVIRAIRIPRTKVVLGGSSAKGTWLRDDHDIDIYVKFDKKTYAGKDISKVLSDHLPFKDAKVLHGSRDYYQIEREGYTIELIPILEIKKADDAENITDMSPFHSTWVKRHTRYKNDILLAKTFAKANNLYGAESYIRGFSGYAMEVLTIHYRGFEKLLDAVARWKQKMVIDTEKHHKGDVKINPAKMVSPLILIDPVQHSRNVTAVVSQEKYQQLIRAVRAYQRNPSQHFFVRKAFSVEALTKKPGVLVLVEAVPFDGKRDVVGAKIIKFLEFLWKAFEDHEFSVKEKGWHWDDVVYLWLFLRETPRSKTVKHYGPPLSEKDRLAHFKEKWKKYKLHKEDGRCYIFRDREFADPETLLAHLIAQEYTKSKVAAVSDHKVYK